MMKFQMVVFSIIEVYNVSKFSTLSVLKHFLPSRLKPIGSLLMVKVLTM